jgi:lysozyme
MEQVVVCDVSRHNGKIDFAKMKGAGADAVVIRGSMGESGFDENWEKNYRGAIEAGLLVGMYHLFFPDLSPELQVRNIENRIHGKTLDFPIVVDAEMTRGCTPAQITGVLRKVLHGAPAIGGNGPVIYTRGEWWLNNVLRSSEWRKFPLWVAMYSNIATHPWVGQKAYYNPRDWQDWTLWQWSADGNGMGPRYGTEGNSVDLSRWSPTQPRPRSAWKSG